MPPYWEGANWPLFPLSFVSVKGNCCPVDSARKWALSPPPHFLNRGLDTWAQDVLDSVIVARLTGLHPAGPTVRMVGAVTGRRPYRPGSSFLKHQTKVIIWQSVRISNKIKWFHDRGQGTGMNGIVFCILIEMQMSVPGMYISAHSRGVWHAWPFYSMHITLWIKNKAKCPSPKSFQSKYILTFKTVATIPSCCLSSSIEMALLEDQKNKVPASTSE